MKIMFVSNLYGELARGGAERVVEAEARSLAAAGHDVVIVTAGRERKTVEMGAAPRVIRYRPPNVYFYSDDNLHAWPARFVWHLLDTWNVGSAKIFDRILDAEKPDVVHTHNLMGLGFLIPSVIRKRGVRHVHTVHDVQLVHPSGLIPPAGNFSPFVRPAVAAYAALMRRRIGSPDAVIFPSEFIKDFYGRYGFFSLSRRIVLRNPAPSARTTARVRPSSAAFLFVGQLEKHKGILSLLDAWEKTHLQNATLEIAGTGSIEPVVRERAAWMTNVRMLGKLGGADLIAAYDRASFTVVPSLVIENAPGVIMESMSRGTPVVAAATGGIPELVGERRGILFKSGGIDDCAAAIRRAAEMMSEWEMLSEKSRSFAAAYGIDQHRAALIAAYAD